MVKENFILKQGFEPRGFLWKTKQDTSKFIMKGEEHVLEHCVIQDRENNVEYGYEFDDSCEVVREDPVPIDYDDFAINEMQTFEV